MKTVKFTFEDLQMYQNSLLSELSKMTVGLQKNLKNKK